MGNQYALSARRVIATAVIVVATPFGLSGVFKTPQSPPGTRVEVAGASVSSGAPQGLNRAAGVGGIDVTVLEERARVWHEAYSTERERNVQEAIEIAQRVEADEQLALDNFLASIVTTTTAPPAPPPDIETEAPVASATAPALPAVPPAEPPTEPATTVPPPPSSTGPSAEAWERLRRCESGGNYGAVSRTGRYRGAYQFSQSTWDRIASARYPHLVGIDPAAAAPADQDAMAIALYEIQGPGAWPVCRTAFG